MGILVLPLLFTLSCKIEDEKTDDSDNIDTTTIEQDGVRGSWTHSGSETEPLVISLIWLIESDQTQVIKSCDFGGEKPVKIRAVARSNIEDNILTFQEEAKKDFTQGPLICSISIPKNASFALSLDNINSLDVTRAGLTTNFKRMKPI